MRFFDARTGFEVLSIKLCFKKSKTDLICLLNRLVFTCGINVKWLAMLMMSSINNSKDLIDFIRHLKHEFSVTTKAVSYILVLKLEHSENSMLED